VGFSVPSNKISTTTTTTTTTTETNTHKNNDVDVDTDNGPIVQALHEVIFEPLVTERKAVSKHLQEYFQNAAQAFHKSVQESTIIHANDSNSNSSNNHLGTRRRRRDTQQQIEEEAYDAYHLDDSSIISLREELALAEKSFSYDTDKSFRSALSQELKTPLSSMPNKNKNKNKNKIPAYPESPEAAAAAIQEWKRLQQRDTKVTLPFPWCTPELLFVPHNELKPPPEATKYNSLPSPSRNEAKDLSQTNGKSSTIEKCSLTTKDNDDDAATTTAAATTKQISSSKPDVDVPCSLPDKKRKHATAVAEIISPDDAVVLYRGKDPSQSSSRWRRGGRSKWFFKSLTDCVFSKASAISYSFCVDCGGPLASCGCDDVEAAAAAAADETEANKLARQRKAVYTIDVGEILSDHSSKFLVIKIPTKKERKGFKRRLKSTNADSNLQAKQAPADLDSPTATFASKRDRSASVPDASTTAFASKPTTELCRDPEIEPLESTAETTSNKTTTAHQVPSEKSFEDNSFVETVEKHTTMPLRDPDTEPRGSTAKTTFNKTMTPRQQVPSKECADDKAFARTAEKNVTVPRPSDPTPRIGTSSKNPPSQQVDYKKQPSDNDDNGGVTAGIVSESQLDDPSGSTSSSSVEARRIVKIGKRLTLHPRDTKKYAVDEQKIAKPSSSSLLPSKCSNTVSKSCEDIKEKKDNDKKNKKKLFRGLRKKMGSMVKTITGKRAKI